MTRSNTNRLTQGLIARVPAGLIWATLAVATAGLLAMPAVAQPMGRMQAGEGMHAFGGHGGHGGQGGFMGHQGRGGMGPMMGGLSERALDDIKATPEQRSQLKQIAEAARKDMQAHRQAGAALRDEAVKLMAQPTVDAAAVEALRQKQMAHHDQASRRMSQAMLDASRVLTPQQRQQLAERMQQRGQMMERHRQERMSLEKRSS